MNPDFFSVNGKGRETAVEPQQKYALNRVTSLIGSVLGLDARKSV